MRNVHCPGVRLRFATKCPLARRASFSGWPAPAGVMAAALPSPQAHALPTKPQAPAVPAPAAPQAAMNYVFVDEFDGPAGSPPDLSKWTVVSWNEPVNPPILGLNRDDRRNVALDGPGFVRVPPLG